MKKLDPILVKGKEAEERCIRLIRSLRNELSIQRMRIQHTGVRLDRLGVDFIVYIQKEGEKQCLKIPIEVKSSYEGVLKYRTKHPECVDAGVVIIVAPTYIPDEGIRRSIKHQLERIIRENVSFESFIKYLRKQGRKLTLPSLHKRELMKLYLADMMNPARVRRKTQKLSFRE